MKDRGNRSTYLTRRIARDHPKILEQMKAGKFKSVRAAAKAAGIVKEPTPGYPFPFTACFEAAVGQL